MRVIRELSQKERDRSHWHYIQAPEEMFVLRKFDSDEDTRYLLKKWLRLERPNFFYKDGKYIDDVIMAKEIQ